MCFVVDIAINNNYINIKHNNNRESKMQQEFKFITLYADVPLTIFEMVRGNDEAAIMRRAFTHGRAMQQRTGKSIRVEAVI